MLLQLQSYDITVINRPGKGKPVVDSLSHQHIKSIDNLGDEDVEAEVHVIVQKLPVRYSRLNEAL